MRRVPVAELFEDRPDEAALPVPGGSQATLGADPIDESADEIESRPPATGRRRLLTLLLRASAVIIAGAAVYFCVVALADSWPSVVEGFRRMSGWLLIAAFLLGFAGTALLAFSWQRCLLLVDGRRWPYRRVVAWFFAGELGKYLPGSVWAVVGRGELAHRAGVRRGVAYTATVLSMVLMLVGVGLVCSVLLPFLVGGGPWHGWEWLVILTIPAAVAMTVPAINRPIFGLLARVSKQRVVVPAASVGRMADVILSSMPAWVLTSSASVVVTAAMGYEQNPARVAFAALLAWVVGFLAVPVPAGLGVREGLFAVLSGLDTGVAFAVAGLVRVLQIVSDALGGLLGLIAVGARHRKSSKKAMP